MKITKILVLCAFAFGLCKPAGAMSFDVKSLKFTGSLDMFLASNAGDRLENMTKADKTSGNISSYKLNTNAAFGGRVGAMHPVENIADFGLSLGYIAGPNGDMKVNGVKYYKDINRRFFRALVEARKDFKFNDKISFLGGAGMGMAFGRQEFVLQTANVINGVSIDTYDKNFNGFTWELSVGASYKATEKLDVELGARYAGFPSCPNTVNDVTGIMDVPGMNWSGLGFFTGVRF